MGLFESSDSSSFAQTLNNFGFKILCLVTVQLARKSIMYDKSIKQDSSRLVSGREGLSISSKVVSDDMHILESSF